MIQEKTGYKLKRRVDVKNVLTVYEFVKSDTLT